MLAWVEENKHLMTVGTKTLKVWSHDGTEVTGLLYDGDLYGWCTYEIGGLVWKGTFFKDRLMGRGKYSLIILNYDNSLCFIVIHGYGAGYYTSIREHDANGECSTTGSKWTSFNEKKITNFVDELGKREGIKLKESYFNRDGLVIRALDKNWASLVDMYS